MISAPPPVHDAIASPRRKTFVDRGDPLEGMIASPRRETFGDRDDPLEGMITEPWLEYLNALSRTLDTAPTRVGIVSLTTQGASISAADVSNGTLAAGVYRLSYYARITRAATASSSLTVTLAWTDGAVSPTSVGAAMTGNTTTTVQSGSILIHVDANSPVTYATTYSSTGATSMQYRLDVTLEKIPA